MNPKTKSPHLWLIIFAASIIASFLLINNAIELPFHDPAADVVSFNESDQAIDEKGQVITNWHANNYTDDGVKAMLLLFTLFAYWKLLGVITSEMWAKIAVLVISIPIMVVGAYVLSFSLYYEF